MKTLEYGRTGNISCSWGRLQPWLRVGGLYRSKERRNDQNRLVYEALNGGFAFNRVALPGERTRILDDSMVLPAGLLPGRARTVLGATLGVEATQADRPSFFETLQDQYETQEEVAGASIGIYQSGARWQWRLGLRHERTQTQTLGTIIGPPDTLAAAGIVPVTTLKIGGQTLLDTADDLDGGRVADDNRYSHWLPSAALGYQLTPKLHVQGMFYRELMRPQYFDIVSYRRINPTVNRIREGNPALQPTLVTSYGVAVRWEPTSSGQYTLELYHKDIDDFFYDALQEVVLDGELFDVSRVDNGPSARITGFRAALAQNLVLSTELSIDIDASYTYSDTTADIIRSDRTVRQTDLPQRSRHLLQGSLATSWGDWSAAVQLRYQSEALDDVGDGASTDIYRDSALIWTGSLRRQLPAAWSAALRVDNVTNTPERSFESSRIRATNNSYSFSFVTLSLSKSF